MEMVKRIRLTGDMPPDKPLAARVRLKLKDGREYLATVETPKGNEISTPMSPREIRAKFIQNVTFSERLPLADAEEALELLERLEDVGNVKSILNLLAGGRSSPSADPQASGRAARLGV